MRHEISAWGAGARPQGPADDCDNGVESRRRSWPSRNQRQHPGASRLTSHRLPGLVGRQSETDRLLTVVTGSGASRTLVLTGDPGIGKSALMDQAAATADLRGCAVLRSQGRPGEQLLEFGVLRDLLRPVLSRRAQLGAPHREVLDALVSDGPQSSPFTIAIAVLELLEVGDDDEWVVLLVDDFQWIDSASAAVLRLVVRRIDDSRISAVLATRTVASAGLELLPRLELHPLASHEADRLLAISSQKVSEATKARVLAEAQGNPLALLELPMAIEAARSPVPGPALQSEDTQLTGRLVEAFGDRSAQLEPEVRACLRVLAVGADNRIGSISAAATELTGVAATPSLWRPAVLAGLVTDDGERLNFRHPLVGSAIRRGSGTVELRAAHLAWAVTLPPTASRQILTHRARAAAPPDDELADELHDAGTRAADRGSLASAQQWLETSAHLSSDAAVRQARLLAAATAAHELGRTGDLHRYLATLRGGRIEPVHARRLAILEAVSSDGAHEPEAGVPALVQLVEGDAEDDPAELIQLLVVAAYRCWWNDLERPRRLVLEAVPVTGLPPDDPQVGLIRALTDTVAAGPELLQQLDGHESEDPDDAAVVMQRANTAFNLADFDRVLRLTAKTVDRLRTDSRHTVLAQMQVIRTWAALFVGEWDLAYTCGDEAFRLATDTRQPVWGAHARLGQADLEGRRGHGKLAAAYLAEANELALLTGSATALSGVEFTRGIIELGLGRPAAAYDCFRHSLDPTDPAFHSVEQLWLVDYFAEAAAAAGQQESAREIVAPLADALGDHPSPGYRQSLALAQLILAVEGEFDQRLSEAHDAPGRHSIWYQARVDLFHGQALRRQRRPRDARRPLERALAAFNVLGAAEWARRARTELLATGKRVLASGSESWRTLSPQELQIATLAADGLSNRQIAQRMYLSHRTVGSHLYRIFPKLGVSTRSQLHQVLPSTLLTNPT